MRTTTCAKPLWQTIRRRRRSTIQNAMAYDAAASGYLSIGTMQTRSTRAISEKSAWDRAFPGGLIGLVAVASNPNRSSSATYCEDHSNDPALQPSSCGIRDRLVRQVSERRLFVHVNLTTGNPP